MKQKDLAKRLDVSTRTLRNWKNLAKDGEFPKVGRPLLDDEIRIHLKDEIKAEWFEQGCPGWRAVKAARSDIPTRLIQSTLKELNFNKRKEQNSFKLHSSHRIKIKRKNIIWAQDTTFIKGKSDPVEVIRDRGTLKYLLSERVESLTGEKIKECVLQVSQKRGYPLVLMTDNGSCYKSEVFKNNLRENHVIHLQSLPRCPQHNGSAERGIRELKHVLRACGDKLNRAVEVLNTSRRYGSKSYQTSEELEKCDKIITPDFRKMFYEEYKRELLRINYYVPNKRMQVLNERKLVFGMLEKYGFINQRKGSLELSRKEEVFL